MSSDMLTAFTLADADCGVMVADQKHSPERPTAKGKSIAYAG